MLPPDLPKYIIFYVLYWIFRYILIYFGMLINILKGSPQDPASLPAHSNPKRRQLPFPIPKQRLRPHRNDRQPYGAVLVQSDQPVRQLRRSCPGKTFGYIQRTKFGVGFKALCRRFNRSSPAVTMRCLGITDEEVYSIRQNEIGGGCPCRAFPWKARLTPGICR